MSDKEATELLETNKESVAKSTVGSGDDELIRTDPGRTSDNAWDSSSPAARSVISRVFQLLVPTSLFGK